MTTLPTTTATRTMTSLPSHPLPVTPWCRQGWGQGLGQSRLPSTPGACNQAAVFHTSWKIFMAIAGLALLLICRCDALSVARAAAITVAWWCGEQMEQHCSWDSLLRRCLCLFLCLGQLPCILPFWIFAKSFELIPTFVNVSGALHLGRHNNMLVFWGTCSSTRFVERWVCGALNNLTPKC